MRSCIHADSRTGPVITLLGAGLARFMVAGRYTHLIGCASIAMTDGGHAAANLYRRIEHDYLSPLEYRVFPRARLPIESLVSDAVSELPPLLKGYLRVGAYVCGEPAWDPDFNTADVLVLAPMSRVNARYARHFLGEAAGNALAGPAPG